MAECRVGDTTLDMRRDRERRIHQHDARPHGEVEMVVDLSCVMPRDRNARKEPAEDGEKASAGRGFEHKVGWGDRGCGGGGEAERDRRGKLLKRLAPFGTA